LGPHWPKLLLLAVLLLVTTGLQIANPQLLRLFIDAATAGGQEQKARRRQRRRLELNERWRWRRWPSLAWA